MIKTSNLLKLYNAGKPNEIKAINNVSLELPDKGMVVILGKSGCGKTTLMNCLGGLDSTNSGTIEIGGHVFSRYDSKQWDSVRNANVGYIFQNYNLINNVTVLRNVELGLEIAGMTDKTEIRRRSLYALNVVGMLKFKNRLPTALSGGQQQRVGIARALAKAPSVIFADEPTGNLDDKNTLAIMDILKGLSEQCLVVLVTHERSIAGYYADRIISIVDGAIVSDELSDATGALRHKAANEIYLGDLKSKKVDVSQQIALKLYADKPIKEPVELSVIFNDGQLYVRADTSIKVRYLDENSETKLIDREYRPLTDGERAEEKFELDRSILSHIEYTERSIFSTRKILRDWNTRRRNKKNRKGSFLTGVMTVLGFILIMLMSIAANFIMFNPLSDTEYNANLVGVKVDHNAKSETYDFNALNDKIKDLNGVEKVLPYARNVSASIKLGYNVISQTSLTDDSIFLNENVDMLPVSLFTSPKMTAGKMPQNANEVAIDAMLAKRLKEDGTLIQMGLTDINDLVGEYMDLNLPEPTPVYVNDDSENHAVYYSGVKKIVGIADNNSPSVYVIDAVFENSLKSFETFEEKKNGEIVQTQWAVVYTSNKKAALSSLKGAGYEVMDFAKNTKSTHFKEALRNSSALIVIMAVLFVICLLSISKQSKSSFILRIRELGIMRAIGATKRNIMKLFLVEGVATTLLTIVLGMLLCCGFLWYNLTYNLTFKSLFYMPVWLALPTIAIVGVISVYFYCLNALRLLEKTPSEILTKYDI